MVAERGAVAWAGTAAEAATDTNTGNIADMGTDGSKVETAGESESGAPGIVELLPSLGDEVTKLPLISKVGNAMTDEFTSPVETTEGDSTAKNESTW